MARRYLAMTPDEWDALAWWQQKMYVEGYVEEGLLGDREDAPVVHQSGGTTITEHKTSSVLDGTPGELAAFGITEQTL